jgi:hypothetical protein
MLRQDLHRQQSLPRMPPLSCALHHPTGNGLCVYQANEIIAASNNNINRRLVGAACATLVDWWICTEILGKWCLAVLQYCTEWQAVASSCWIGLQRLQEPTRWQPTCLHSFRLLSEINSCKCFACHSVVLANEIIGDPNGEDLVASCSLFWIAHKFQIICMVYNIFFED